LIEVSTDDWAMFFDVCERASATEANAKQATEALSREFKYVPADFPRQYFQFNFNFRYGNAQQQLSAAMVRFLPSLLIWA
jgi:hypothetical protein